MYRNIYIIFLLAMLILSGCQPSLKNIAKNHIIYSDTTYRQRFDTAVSKDILRPIFNDVPFNNVPINDILTNNVPNFNVPCTMPVMPLFTIDTTLLIKNKKGEIVGKSNLKISSNPDGTLNFENENIINDSTPTVNNFIPVTAETAHPKGFVAKIEDKILGFIDIVLFIVIVMLIIFLIVLSYRIYKIYRTKQWQSK